jgi:hypothetical protein
VERFSTDWAASAVQCESMAAARAKHFGQTKEYSTSSTLHISTKQRGSDSSHSGPRLRLSMMCSVIKLLSVIDR